MRHFLFGVFILTQLVCFGQISDDFTNVNFTVGPPAWSGNDSLFEVNGSEQLHLIDSAYTSSPPTTSSAYLSTGHNLGSLDGKEWQFWVDLSFSQSTNNNSRYYLTSDSSDLTTDPDGFFIQMGESGTEDTLRLIKSVGGVYTPIAIDANGSIGSSSDFPIRVRVVRDSSGNWDLYFDPTGGTNFGLVDSGLDPTPLLGTYTGMLCNYSSSNSEKFYYDDIYVGNEIVDTTPPSLVSATAATSTQIDALFDEPLDPITAGDDNNYSLVSGLVISGAVLDGTNQALVHLTVDPPGLSNGIVDTLITTGIADVAGNMSATQMTEVYYLVAETPDVGDVVINELMFDPTPVVGQPNVEYVEIYNRSGKILNVGGWEIGEDGSMGTLPAEWLLPDSYMILTKTSAADSFPVAIGVPSFPTLVNSENNVVLLSDTGLELDSMTYLGADWTEPIYDGVSIELINPNDPCSDGSNWKSSTDASGGTPGAQNSVFDTIPDTTDPEISFLLALDPNYLEIHYNEGMDSTCLQNAVFDFSPSLNIDTNYVFTDAAFMQILEFDSDLLGSQTYTIEIQNVKDCWNNTTTLFGEFALPEIASIGDVIINEVLADPVSGGKDWIEIYNNSDKVIDLYNYEVANYDDDSIANFKQIEEHILIGPDGYVVLGEDIAQIAQHYTSVVPDNLYEMDLPTYSNDSGTVYLMSFNQVMDRVSYEDDWHFRLLDNTDGVTLERIDPDGGSSDGNNWHSAAETAGFGTPGMVNSQFYPAIANGDFNYTNDIVSPDSDGYQDVLQINFEMVEEGYVGHFTVYDDRGRLISRVVESELLGSTGTFSWDGVREDGTKASIGTYVGVFEAFQVSGGVVFTKRIPFVVAGKI